MDWTQMRARCPSATFVRVARLADHRLAFTRKSVTRQCGVADVVPERGRSVWGVVYQVPELEVGSLDRSEGYLPGRRKNSYWRRECMVLLDGDENRPLTVQTYFAEPDPNPPPPNREYMTLILSGARFWHLPAEYIAELEAIEVSG